MLYIMEMDIVLRISLCMCKKWSADRWEEGKEGEEGTSTGP